MINIRTNMFETNSSSVHSFILPKGSKNIKIPSSIKLNGPEDTEDQLGRIRYMYQLACEIGYGTDFIRYLKFKGINIEDEEYNDTDTAYMCSSLDITVDELDQICFNPDLIDEYDDKKFEEVKDDYENYDHIEVSNR